MLGDLPGTVLYTGDDATITTPSTQLPFEIMAYIFELACLAPSALERDMPSTTLFGRYRSRVLEAITSTCTHWRAVALARPSLWSSICFNLIEEDNHRLRGFTDLAMVRSGTFPLLIYAQGNASSISFVRSNIARCQHLHYELFTMHPFLACAFMLTQKLPLLRSLVYIQRLPTGQISEEGSYAFDDVEIEGLEDRASLRERATPGLDLTSATSLQSLSLQLCFNPSFIILPPPHLCNLRRLRLDLHLELWDQIENILTSCPDLTTLDWSVRYMSESRHYNVNVLHLPQLLHLRLVCPSIFEHGILELREFIMPNLERLHLCVSGWDSDAVRGLPVYPKLRYLRIHSQFTMSYSQPFIPFLEAHPGLEEIELSWVYLDESIVELFGSTQSPVLKFTKLRRLVLNCRHIDVVKNGRILLMNRARQVKSLRLQAMTDGIPNLVLQLHLDRIRGVGKYRIMRNALAQLKDEYPGQLCIVAEGNVDCKDPRDDFWDWQSKLGRE